MLTRKALAKRWGTTPRTIDRRRTLGLLPWIDLTRGAGKRPQIRFMLEDIEEYERQARLNPGGRAGDLKNSACLHVASDESQREARRIDPEARG